MQETNQGAQDGRQHLVNVGYFIETEMELGRVARYVLDEDERVVSANVGGLKTAQQDGDGLELAMTSTTHAKKIAAPGKAAAQRFPATDCRQSLAVFCARRDPSTCNCDTTDAGA
jgi:hypothetical protein